jgi:hypothetical protein
MPEQLLLLPEGWPRLLALVVATGILALTWARRVLVEALHSEGDAEKALSLEIMPVAEGPSSKMNEELPPQRSLVLVARNEACRLPALLGDLERLLEEDEGLEILLADDSSTDGTRQLMEDFAAQARAGRVTLMPAFASRRGKPAWLRHTVSQCRGQVLLFTDADCRLGPRWSRAMEELLDLRGPEPHAAAGGLVLLEECGEADAVHRWQRLHWILLSATGAALGIRRPGRAPSLWGANLVFHRPAVEALGGYAALAAVDRGEDLHFVRSLLRANARVRLAAFPRATRVRTAAVDAPGVVRQVARWGASLFALGPLEMGLVLGMLLWLLALVGIFLVKPVLGLLLLGVALMPLGALLDELAASLGEESAGLSGAALYLAAWYLLLPAALLQGLRGDRRWRRPA